MQNIRVFQIRNFSIWGVSLGVLSREINGAIFDR